LLALDEAKPETIGDGSEGVFAHSALVDAVIEKGVKHRGLTWWLDSERASSICLVLDRLPLEPVWLETSTNEAEDANCWGLSVR
jgi:hypothetical protein